MNFASEETSSERLRNFAHGHATKENSRFSWGCGGAGAAQEEATRRVEKRQIKPQGGSV